MTFYHVYADESRQNASRFMLFGALFVPRGAAEEALLADIAALRVRLHLTAEMKWNKVSRAKQEAYREFIDVLFPHPEAAFRCLVVDTHKIDYRQHHNSDKELGFYTFYGYALSRNMDAAHRYLVFTDARSNRLPNRLSDLKDTINAYWQAKGVAGDIVRNVEPRVSKDSDLLQLVDVLLGAVGYAIEEYDTSPPKVALVEHLKACIGEDLRTHRGRGTGFNIWRFRFPDGQ